METLYRWKYNRDFNNFAINDDDNILERKYDEYTLFLGGLMADEIKNIFVSHQHNDADKIEAFKNLIGKHGIDMRDSSIYEKKLKNNATNEQYIKQELIKPQISWAGTIVVLIGKDTAKSDYVNWEIKTAGDMGKRIVGVYLQGAKEEDVPEELNEYGHALVGWDGEKIVRAIDGEDMDWEKPDGTSRDSNPAAITHYIC